MLRRFFDRELFPRHDLTACPACVWVVNRMGLYEVRTHAQVKWHNRRIHNQGSDVPRSPQTGRAELRKPSESNAGNSVG